MNAVVYLRIGGVLIGFDTRFPEYVRERCGKYVVEEESLSEGERAEALCLRASEADIERANVENVGKMEAELYAMTIPLSEKMPGMGRLMTHGVAVECDGKSYIFTAESGVGKSTHAFLWQKYLGEDRVRVINGDKPILWFADGDDSESVADFGDNAHCENVAGRGDDADRGRRVLACGSPWSGKERLDVNVCVPLGGICLLQRLESVPDPENGPRIYRATKKETFDFLLHQIFLPTRVEGQLLTFDLIEELYELVPIYNLVTDMSREGVMVSSGKLLKGVE